MRHRDWLASRPSEATARSRRTSLRENVSSMLSFSDSRVGEPASAQSPKRIVIQDGAKSPQFGLACATGARHLLGGRAEVYIQASVPGPHQPPAPWGRLNQLSSTPSLPQINAPVRVRRIRIRPRALMKSSNSATTRPAFCQAQRPASSVGDIGIKIKTPSGSPASTDNAWNRRASRPRLGIAIVIGARSPESRPCRRPSARPAGAAGRALQRQGNARCGRRGALASSDSGRAHSSQARLFTCRGTRRAVRSSRSENRAAFRSPAAAKKGLDQARSHHSGPKRLVHLR